jgi:hypothetical protein
MEQVTVGRRVQRRRLVHVFGENDAIARSYIEARESLHDEAGNELSGKVIEIPLTEAEIGEVLGEAEVGQAKNIDMLTKRLLKQREEAEAAMIEVNATHAQELQDLRDTHGLQLGKILKVQEEDHKAVADDFEKLKTAAQAEITRLAGELAATNHRANVAEGRLAAIAEADRAYDAHVGPIYKAAQANGAQEGGPA